MKSTFEVLQKIVMELKGCTLYPRKLRFSETLYEFPWYSRRTQGFWNKDFFFSSHTHNTKNLLYSKGYSVNKHNSDLRGESSLLPPHGARPGSR